MPMKHEEKTMQTKKALAAVLKTKLCHKPLSKITVSEIIADCEVNRKTFYYHFQDIYDLLHWMLDQEAIEIVKNFDLITDYEEAIHFILDYVEENEHILNCMFDSMGRDQLKRFFYSDFIGIARKLILSVEAETGYELDEPFRDFLSRFYTEAIAGILTEWIQDNQKYSRQTALEYISLIFFHSIPNIIRARSTREPFPGI